MDYLQLKTFISLAESGSFSASAEELNITQPAVSKRIAQLEAQLDCRLFDRIGKTNRLTDAGELTLSRAKRILKEHKELKHDLANLNDSISGKLVISTSHHIGLHRLPEILRKFVERFPHVELDMRFTDSEIAYHDVIQGETSLAIATLPAQIDNTRIRILPLWKDQLELVCARNHPLNQCKTIAAAQLEQYPAILPGKETFTRRIIDNYFMTNHFKLKLAFETNYLETIRIMTATGLGWSILPRILTNESLNVIPFADLNLCRTLGIMLNKNLTLPNSARQLIKMLVQHSDQSNRQALTSN